MTVLVLAAAAAGTGVVAPNLLRRIAAHGPGCQSLAPRRREEGKDILHAIEHVVNDRGTLIVGNRGPVFIQTEVGIVH